MMNSTNNGYINVYNSSSLVVPTGGLMAITTWSPGDRIFNTIAPIDGVAIERLVVAPYTIQAKSKGIAYTSGICMVTQGSDVESYPRVGITNNDFVATEGDLFTVLTYVAPGMCLIRLGGGGGGTGDNNIRIAYPTDYAGSSAILQCRLDDADTGELVTVHFSIAGDGIKHLNSCLPRLIPGNPIFVSFIAARWYCLGAPFIQSIDCECT